MTLSFKAGVSIRNIQPEILLALTIADQTFSELGFDTIVTSGTDGTHSVGSRHYTGHALDLRSKHLPDTITKLAIGDTIADRLEPLGDYSCFLEHLGGAQEHFHLQFKPKGAHR